jgi:hypothetical protein
MSTDQAYRSRPIKRQRRTRAGMDAIRQAICDALSKDHPMTVRQLFYRLVSGGVIEKTEAEYKGTIVRLTGEMRLAGEIEWVQPVWLQLSRRRKPLKSGGKATLPEIGHRRLSRRGAIIPGGGLIRDAQGTYPDR